MDTLAVALASHVGEMLRLARVHRQIVRTGIFADDHSLVDLLLWPDEEAATLLDRYRARKRCEIPPSMATSTPLPRRDFALCGRIP